MRLLTTAFALTVAARLFAAELGNQNPVVAHEWGTFTSVAGADGDPVRWEALLSPPDLPCFVERGPVYKSEFSALVRMETPVLYFYATRAARLSVDVSFPLGNMTEWYPKATRADGGHLTWDSVELTPGENPTLPTTQGESRYFAARNTDATPLKIGGQAEKMIFYRGVGGFAVPLRPKFTADGKIEIRKISEDSIPIVIVFENRAGKLGYRVAPNFTEAAATFDHPELDGNIAGIRKAIGDALVERGGLYPKEAQAMLDTWQDSWFEEGMRVIYILPQRPVDAVLPLTIQPAPVETTRVFVGRIEMLSPTMKNSMAAAVASGEVSALEKAGRFLGPFAAQIGATSSAAYRKAEMDLLTRLNSHSCVR